MTRTIKLLLKSILLPFLFIFSGCSESIKTTESQVNVVFILADDMGWNQVKYHNITGYYDTPNIDKISLEGMQFTNAYSAAPVCTPARASIMTGKYPARLHLTDYLPGNPYPYAKLKTEKQSENGLPLNEITLGELFKEQGYVTGHFGKWHLNKDKNYKLGRPGDPGSQGFDDVLSTVKPEITADPNKDPHHVKEITDRTISFIEKNKEEPFFAYVSHHVVHRPIMENKDLINSYKTKPNSESKVNNPIMGAMIERMDRSIGRILNKLEELNLSENTIIIFFSDNGGFKYYQDQAPLRGGKAMVFEGGIRVPLVIKWPGMIKPGTVSEFPVISNDFFPTLADIIGADYDKKSIDGNSLTTILKGGSKIDREAIYWHYPHYHRQGYKPSGAIRMGDYKLIEWYERTAYGEEHQVDLFNIKDDISENSNLADEKPELAKKMLDKLHKWLNDVGAQQMKVNSNYNFEKQYLPELEWPAGKDFEYLDMQHPNKQ
ncbi:MAG: sulfatase [Bacteroidetes bacterium]|nr:MAG: sulfatase [Bacteroidota bacterium]